MLDSLVVKNYFSDHDPCDTGKVIKQPELAECLMTMHKLGWQDFYHGTIATKIIEDMEKRAGLITAADLYQIPTPVERKILESSYRDYDLYTFPPPGAGRVLVQISNTLEQFSKELLDPEKPLCAVIFALAFCFSLTADPRRDGTAIGPQIINDKGCIEG